MPPPIPEHVKRYTANPSRPARYRPGKAVQEVESSEDEDDEEEDQPQKSQPKQPARPAARLRAPQRPAQDEDDEDEAGFVTEEEEEDDRVDGGAPLRALPAELTKAATHRVATSAQHEPHTLGRGESKDEEDEEDDEDSEGEESSEAESSSEEEAPQRKFQRPKFIKKTEGEGNQTTQDTQTETSHDQRSRTSLAPEVLSSAHTESTTARRLAEAESQIKSTIERETAARLAGRKNWDDDDDLPPEALVDDTDGLDPEAEHSAWRLRELHRLKRDREALVAREKELEEIERRRNLTKEEREAEDRDFIANQRQSKEEGRGQAGYLARYHHKGAFFLDDGTSQRLRERNLVGAKFQDEVADKSALPEYMRVRDMTKLGKKGRTRYTDLRDQDTGRFGDSVKKWKGSGYENREQGQEGDRVDVRGVDERFLPDSDDHRRRHGGPDVSGANASELGRKRERRRSRSRSFYDDDGDGDGNDSSDRRRDRGRGDSYRRRSRSRSIDSARRYRRRRSYSRSPSRSRSPPYKSRRRRSPSPYGDVDRDRRRRVAA